MTTWFVTRHNGAVFWAARKKLYAPDMKRVADLDPDQVQRGEIVYGTLPVNLVARIIARGGRYFHLSMNIPPELRGKDLSADEMEQIEATLQEFHAHSISPAKLLSKLTGEQGENANQPVVLINLCSGERMQNLLPVAELSPSFVYLLHTSYSGSVTSAQDLQKAIQLLGSKKTIEVTLCQYDQLSSLENGLSLREIALDILSRHESARIVCNITGGNKLMAQELREFATEWSLESLYCDTGEGGIRILYPDRPVWTSRVIPFMQTINLPQFLAAQGMTLVSQEKVQSAESEQLALAEAIFKKSLTHFKNRGKDPVYQDLNNLMFLIGHNKDEQTTIELRRPDKKDKCKDLLPDLEHFLIKNNLVKIRLNQIGVLECTFLPVAGMTDEQTKKFLGGVWFEIIFARAMVDALIRANTQANAHFGVKVVFTNNTSEKLDNEIDCALLFKNRMFMLELKAGAGFLEMEHPPKNNKEPKTSRKQDNNATYKGLSILEKIGGAMARYSFIVNSDNLASQLASQNPRFKNYQLDLAFVDDKARSAGLAGLTDWICNNVLDKLH